MEDEREALEAIYATDFEEAVDPSGMLRLTSDQNLQDRNDITVSQWQAVNRNVLFAPSAWESDTDSGAFGS
eukprot:3352557-Amphidinium_carterae.2